MLRLKIILQSKLFIVVSLIFLILYIFLMTKVVVYESKYDSTTTEITGEILEYKIDGGKLSLTVKDKEKLKATYYFESEEEKLKIEDSIKLGMDVNLSGVLSEPYNNTIPNTFNYKNYLYNNKIYYTMNVESLELLDNKISLLYKLKNFFINSIDINEKTGTYIYAFILGDSGNIDNDVYETYQNNGVTHLFAVSGMHVSFLVLAIDMILKKIKVKEKYINIGITGFLAIYMFLIGFTASVVRASLLYIFTLINKKLNINLNSKIILYLLFCLLILINPFYIYDLGFEYSFLTTFGLMIFSDKISGNYLIKTVKVSFIAFIFSLPITLLNFYEFNLLTVLNNIIIVPIVSLVVFPLSIITFILPFLDVLLNLSISILEYISNFLNSMSINIVVPKINMVFIVLYYITIYFIYKKSFKNVFFLVVLISLAKLFPLLDSKSYVYYLDVGQGDSSLIITEHRRDVILIDTGGMITYKQEAWKEQKSTYNPADNIVTFLKSLGITNINLLICTHGDIDHVGYAEDIAKRINIHKVMFNNNDYNNYEAQLKEMIKTEIKDNYVNDNIKIYNLNKDVYDNENDSSLVLYAELSNKKLLFMGDAPKEVELKIMNSYQVKADILKVGHHGSKTSSDATFIAEVKPVYSIISAGRKNRYGHPNEEVLDNLEGTMIYRTDLNGSIVFELKNNKFNIETFAP